MTNTAALLVIDSQSVLLADAYRPDVLLDRISALARRARAAEAPVVYLRQELSDDEVPAGADPLALPTAIAPRPGDLVLDKHSPDPFLGTGLAELLRERGVGRIVVTGYSTETCVDTTVRSGLSHGYDVTLVGDAHTTNADFPGDLSPAQVIAHHNLILGHLPYAHHSTTVTPAADVTF